MLCVNSPSMIASMAPPAQNSIRICRQKHWEHKTWSFLKHDHTVLQKYGCLHYIAQNRLTEISILSLFPNVHLGTIAALCLVDKSVYPIDERWTHLHAASGLKHRQAALIQTAIVHSTRVHKQQHLELSLSLSHEHIRVCSKSMDKTRTPV